MNELAPPDLGNHPVTARESPSQVHRSLRPVMWEISTVFVQVERRSACGQDQDAGTDFVDMPPTALASRAFMSGNQERVGTGKVSIKGGGGCLPPKDCWHTPWVAGPMIWTCRDFWRMVITAHGWVLGCESIQPLFHFFLSTNLCEHLLCARHSDKKP